MTTAPAMQPTVPLLGDWQPLPTAGAQTPAAPEQPAPQTIHEAKPFLTRLAAAGHWARDTLLGITGFVIVLGVAIAGWTASFIGLHDFGMHHMGLSDGAAWLVPLTFDGAPAGLSLVVFRASANGRGATVWRLLIVVFTGLSSWINYQHIDDPLGRGVASFMPPSAVVLFEGLMSEARAAAEKRMGRQRPRVHPLRWFMDRKGTWALYRAYVLGIELPDHLRTTPADTTTDRTERTETADHGPDQSTNHALHDGPQQTDRTETSGPRTPDRTAAESADRTAITDHTSGPDRTDTTDRATRTTPPVHTDRAAKTTPTPADRTTRTARTADDTTDRTADQEPDRLVLTDLEVQAIDRLRTTDRSISKRSIQDVIRNELGGSIASDRAVQIARHFRTLRSAA